MSVDAKAKAALSPAQKALQKLGLLRDIDFCLHLPLRYEDETHITRLCDARSGESLQIEATIQSSHRQPRGQQLVLQVQDESDRCTLRFFHCPAAMIKTLAVGARFRFRGEVQRSPGLGLTMLHPSFKPASLPLAQALTPIYPSVAQLPQTYLRKAVHGALERAMRQGQLSETLWDVAWDAPHALVGVRPPLPLSDLPSLAQSLMLLHRPPPDAAIATLSDKTHPAWQRLIAEELLAQQLSQQMARAARAQERAHPLIARPEKKGETKKVEAKKGADFGPSLEGALRHEIGFVLTGAQERCLAEIEADLALPTPMHRLLQGDVGSGKTVVAALAAARCVDAQQQCALMVPTEILATQHFAKLITWIEPLLTARGQTVAWLWGTQKAKERRRMLQQIASGTAALVVGTHAIVQKQVQFKSLALVIIDEQHRFGVAQRLALKEKTTDRLSPHLLMMSATPIPRTLAMSYLADLDISTLDEHPPGRTPVLTKLLHNARRDLLNARIDAHVKEGRQAYWVCPMIEESDAVDLVNATQTHAHLQAALPQCRVALLHAKRSAQEKRDIMAQFAAGHIDVLVSTTVIEVGVDVPNATIMVIEHAERFGLAQLHQLRGRVGRGSGASVCILLYDTGPVGRLSEAAKARLKAMVQTTDGFKIAERDLHIRGPGDFLGERQSGLQMLRFASPTERQSDAAWLGWARAMARVLLHEAPEKAHQHLRRWLPHGASFLGV